MALKDILSQECLCGNADVQSADQATRIVGGKESVPDKHPWQAELYFDTLSNLIWACEHPYSGGITSTR